MDSGWIQREHDTVFSDTDIVGVHNIVVYFDDFNRSSFDKFVADIVGVTVQAAPGDDELCAGVFQITETDLLLFCQRMPEGHDNTQGDCFKMQIIQTGFAAFIFIIGGFNQINGHSDIAD